MVSCKIEAILKFVERVIVARHQLNNFSVLSWSEQSSFWWDEGDAVQFVLDKHTSWILQCYSMKHRQTCHLIRTHDPNSEPTRFYSYSLMLHTDLILRGQQKKRKSAIVSIEYTIKKES